MPRYCCLLDEHALRTHRNTTGDRASACNVPAAFIEWRDPGPGQPPPGNAVPDGMAPMHRFDAADREQAERYFRRMQHEGCPSRWDIVGNAGTDSVPGARPWRFRDGYHHARGRLKGSGLPANAEGSVRSCPQYKAIGSLLGQVNELYHRSRKEAGVAVLAPHERMGVLNSLQKCEEALAVMGLMVEAGCEMIDPAYAALGVPHRRAFRLAIDDPTPPPPPEAEVPPPTDPSEPDATTKPQRRSPARA